MDRVCKAPCPGCGEPDKRRAANSVCGDCYWKIKNAEKMAAVLERQRDKKLEFYHIPDESRGHDLPYLHHGNHGGFGDRQDLRDDFNRLLHAVSLGEMPAWGTVEPIIPRAPIYGSVHALPPGFAPAFQNLYAKTGETLQRAYTEGVEDGSNMLRQMMDGEITNTEINERITRENKG